MPSSEKGRKLPEPEFAEGAAATAKAALNLMLPGIGGAAAEFLSIALAPALSARRDRWLQDLADDLTALEERVDTFNLRDLKDNDEFISAVLHASQIAIRTHQKTKIDALRNAVLQVAGGRAPDADFQLIFLRLVDTFTPWHLQILRYFQEPRRYREEEGKDSAGYGAAPSMLLEDTFPDLKGKSRFYDLIVKDLENANLLGYDTLSLNLSSTWLHEFTTTEGAFSKRTTSIGDQFLRFIQSPID